MKEKRPYSFNGINFPKFVFCSIIIDLDLAKEVYAKAKEGDSPVLNFTGIVSGNIHVDDACVYFRTGFIFPLNKATDKNGVEIV